MLKGTNTLILNQASMVEILQFWTDSFFPQGHAPRVKNVFYEEISSLADSFRVEWAEKDPEKV